MFIGFGNIHFISDSIGFGNVIALLNVIYYYLVACILV